MASVPGDHVRHIIQQLGLQRHPEGGWFVRTWRDVPTDGGRGAGSAIYYLLRRGEVSRWHRLDATEIWHVYAGAPLELRVARPGQHPRTVLLGTDVQAGQRPQAVVPPGDWQSARSLGEYTLAGTTVTPAFTYDGFEVAPEGWQPPDC